MLAFQLDSIPIVGILLEMIFLVPGNHAVKVFFGSVLVSQIVQIGDFADEVLMEILRQGKVTVSQCHAVVVAIPNISCPFRRVGLSFKSSPHFKDINWKCSGKCSSVIVSLPIELTNFHFCYIYIQGVLVQAHPMAEKETTKTKEKPKIVPGSDREKLGKFYDYNLTQKKLIDAEKKARSTYRRRFIGGILFGFFTEYILGNSTLYDNIVKRATMRRLRAKLKEDQIMFENLQQKGEIASDPNQRKTDEV